jgi:hypothetical protein
MKDEFGVDQKPCPSSNENESHGVINSPSECSEFNDQKRSSLKPSMKNCSCVSS